MGSGATGTRGRARASRADAGAIAGMNFNQRFRRMFWRGRQNQHARRVRSPNQNARMSSQK